MTIDTNVTDLAAGLESARSAAQQIAMDRDLTAAAKQTRAAAVMARAREDAVSALGIRMQLADTEALAAETALDEAQRAHEAALDFARLNVALAEVGALAGNVRDAAQGAGVIEAVLASGDYYRIRALATAGLAQLRGPMTAAGARGAMQLADLESRVAERLAELEPEALKAKRAAAAAAQGVRNTLRANAVTMGLNYAPEPGYLRSWRELDALVNPSRTVTTRTPNGGYIIERVGGGLFG